MSVSALDRRAPCQTFTSTPEFRTEPDPSRDYPRIVASVKLEVAPDPEPCRPRSLGFNQNFRGEWRWDQGRKQFRPVWGNLEKL